jgi:DNA-binding HxlR family transcriptional regulator
MKNAMSCPITTALAVIGGKWKVIILWQLQGKVKRFGELQKSIPGISQKMLTQELRDLEESGLILRKVYAVVPPRVEYSWTEFGLTIAPVMEQLCAWGVAYQDHMQKVAVEKLLNAPVENHLEAVPI